MQELGTTRPPGLISLDSDFQTRYVAAERAYGAGDFQAALAIVSALLAELQPLLDAGEERDAALAWQAFVALLSGHIHLYGLQQPGQARSSYSLVLSSDPPDTLRQLAEQGLERLAEQREVPMVPAARDEPGQAALISDPFLAAAAASERTDASHQPAQPSATPWLDRPSEPPELPDPPEAPVENDPEPEGTVVALHPTADSDATVEESATIEVDGAITEEPTVHAAGDKRELSSKTPVPEGLLQRLEAGRLRVTL